MRRLDLDFASPQLFVSDDRWLEIQVRPSGGVTTVLDPRQPIRPVPRSLRADTDLHSISVLDPVARFLIAGDALNGEPDGGGVLGPNPAFTADMSTAIESARKLGMLDFDDAYFGHGEPLLGDASAAVATLAASLLP